MILGGTYGPGPPGVHAHRVGRTDKVTTGIIVP